MFKSATQSASLQGNHPENAYASSLPELLERHPWLWDQVVQEALPFADLVDLGDAFDDNPAASTSTLVGARHEMYLA